MIVFPRSPAPARTWTLLKHLQRLLQVDDIDPVALSEDVFLHLGIPSARLMPEVNTCFEQFFIVIFANHLLVDLHPERSFE